MKHFYSLMLGLLLSLCSLTAQETVTISGYVKDADTGETLLGANISVLDQGSNLGTVTNDYGFYSLRVPAGDSITVEYSYIGYATQTRRILPTPNLTVTVELAFGEELITVEVTADANREKVNSTQMGLEQLSMAEAKLLPALFGEVDIIKTLQLKPGVSNGGEGTSGLVVRGGSPDQNLFLLDEAVLYNPSHLFGFFSTFNSDAVKSVDLYKGGFPAEYGGRLSSVIDVKLNDGNNKRFGGKGGIGLIASRLTLEGPIQKNKSSFIVSGRRTYADIFTRAINDANADNPDAVQIPDYYFYDLNGKASFELGEQDRIFVSGYFGRDFFTFSTETFDLNFNWGNNAATARWNHIYNSQLFSNVTLSYSSYDYVIQNSIPNIATFELGSGIEDVTLKADWYYSPDNRHNVRFGATATYHTFEVGRLRAGDEAGTFSFTGGQNFDAIAPALYISDDFRYNDKWTINYGLRLSGFYNDEFYANLEPRAAVKYSVSDDVSLKGSYTYMTQYIHLVGNSAGTLPTDVWFPSTERVRPQLSQQVAGGVFYAINPDWYLSTEAFYKWSDRQVDFREGANLFVNDNLEDEFVFGDAWSYGAEVYLEKKNGPITGWVGYTLSWSWRQFDEILQGRKFHPSYDRRHDLSVVALYEFGSRDQYALTGTWVYSTGNLTTLPFGRFFLQDAPGISPPQESGALVSVVPVYTDRNSFRLRSYQRLDLGFVWKFRPRGNFKSDLTVGVYNAYDRRNPFAVFIDTDFNDEGVLSGVQPRQISLFPILPSVTWNFEF